MAVARNQTDRTANAPAVCGNHSTENHHTMRLIRYVEPTRSAYLPALGAFSRAPWSGLESELDRLFESALGDFAGFGYAPERRFPVDLYEDKDNAYVRAELPGVTKDDINVEFADGYLTLTATRKSPEKNGDSEPVATVSRSVSLPDTVQADKANASFENGVLTITLPKKEEAKPRTIKVEVR